MKCTRLCTGVAVMVMITGVMSGFISGNVGAEEKSVTISRGQSYIFFCAVTYKVTYDHEKLKEAESKTVGCDTDKIADIHLNPYKPDKRDYAKVFWCDHDNPLVWADSDSMKSGDVWTIRCLH